MPKVLLESIRRIDKKKLCIVSKGTMRCSRNRQGLGTGRIGDPVDWKCRCLQPVRVSAGHQTTEDKTVTRSYRQF
jgi:hypothetical protein